MANEVSNNKSSVPATVGTESSIKVGAASARVISTHPEVDENKGLVKIKVAYPKDYAGVKYMVDGKTYLVSKETAEGFIKAKIATKV